MVGPGWVFPLLGAAWLAWPGALVVMAIVGILWKRQRQALLTSAGLSFLAFVGWLMLIVIIVPHTLDNCNAFVPGWEIYTTPFAASASVMIASLAWSARRKAPGPNFTGLFIGGALLPAMILLLIVTVLLSRSGSSTLMACLPY